MYFRLSKGVAFLIFISLFTAKYGLAEQVLQNNVLLQIKPATCVALNQGRTCYAQVNIHWSSKESDDFCIYQKQLKRRLKCWEKSKGDSYSFEFESDQSITYQLVNMENKAIAEASVNVSWVHQKSPRKRRWRLF